MSKPTLIFLVIAGVAILAVVALFAADIIAEQRKRRRLALAAPDAEDHALDARLAHLEMELTDLRHEFQASGLADYPGGPLTVQDSGNEHDRKPDD